MIRPVPGATADAVVDVQVQRTGGESRLKDEEVVLFCLAEKRAERTCGEEKMATPGWTEKKRSSAPMRRGGDPQKIYWEGINLNKISKKIVSAVTMGAFALTLIPAAAFAEPVPVGSSNTATVDMEDQTLYINDSVTTANATIDVTVGANGLDTNGNRLVFWYDSDADGNLDGQPDNTSVTMTASASLTGGNNQWRPFPDGQWGQAWWLEGQTAGAIGQITATFNETGTYDLYASHCDVVDVDSFANVAADNKVKVGTVKVVTTNAIAKDSFLLIGGNGGPAEATAKTEKTFSFAVRNGESVTNLPLATSGEKVYVWVENSKGELVKDAQFVQTKDAKGNPTSDLTAADPNGDGIWEVSGAVNDKDTLNVIFPDAGNGYEIHAGVADAAPSVNNNKVVAASSHYLNEVNEIVVNVAAKTAVATDIVVGTVDGDKVTTVKDDYYTIRIDDEVTPSKTKEYVVKGTAYENLATNNVAENVEIDLTVDNGMTIVGDSTVKTDANGDFTFKYKVDDAASYVIKMVSGDATSYLKVTHGDVDAVHIEKIADGGYVLAGTDKDYGKQVYGDGSELFSDAVQIGITDAYGRDAVGEGVLADEWAARNDDATKHANVVSIENQPTDADLDASNFYLAWDENAGVYTVKYEGAAKDLLPGEYQVRIALNNGGDNAISVKFTAAEFGEVQDIVLDMTARPVNSWDSDANNENSIKVIDDQVALGQHVAVTPKYVDENGLKVEIENYRNLNVGINGDAVAHNGMIWFETQDNIGANNSLIGSTITVKINDLNTNKYVEKELTVVKNYLNETVSIDPTQGVVGEANTVTVSVVDEDGNVSKVNGKLSATIVGQSDEEATVDLKVNPQVKNGTARMYLESDKAGTVDVRVVVTANNGELYADTFTYTFGDEDPYAGTSVVMTIGSDQYLINNELFDGSVDNLGAPYVDSAWRTMVPARILAETFGGTVEFDEVDGVQTVSIVNGDTTIEMTVGSADYTINGEAAKAMDTEPVIVDGRTYVPVRFVAEGLGLDVTPLYDAETGTTSSVVFQK